MRNRINFRVSAALIIHDGRVLAAELGYGRMERILGIPGGRQEEGETGEEGDLGRAGYGYLN